VWADGAEASCPRAGEEQREQRRGEVARGVSKQQTQRWSGVESVSGGDERRKGGQRNLRGAEREGEMSQSGKTERGGERSTAPCRGPSVL
jgi:hypothetical protein